MRTGPEGDSGDDPEEDGARGGRSRRWAGAAREACHAAHCGRESAEEQGRPSSSARPDDIEVATVSVKSARRLRGLPGGVFGWRDCSQGTEESSCANVASSSPKPVRRCCSRSAPPVDTPAVVPSSFTSALEEEERVLAVCSGRCGWPACLGGVCGRFPSRESAFESSEEREPVSAKSVRRSVRRLRGSPGGVFGWSEPRFLGGGVFARESVSPPDGPDRGSG